MLTLSGNSTMRKNARILNAIVITAKEEGHQLLSQPLVIPNSKHRRRAGRSNAIPQYPRGHRAWTCRIPATRSRSATLSGRGSPEVLFLTHDDVGEPEITIDVY